MAKMFGKDGCLLCAESICDECDSESLIRGMDQPACTAGAEWVEIPFPMDGVGLCSVRLPDNVDRAAIDRLKKVLGPLSFKARYHE